MKRILCLMLLAICTMQGVVAKQKKPIIVAYVASWGSQRMPDPTLMTHLNYAFGKVTDTFDGMTIQNTDFLRKVMKLKEQNPELKIILSIGGWTAGNFSEMAADERFRMGFARDCKKAVDEYGLDGIDIDWEYPSSN